MNLKQCLLKVDFESVWNAILNLYINKMDDDDFLIFYSAPRSEDIIKSEHLNFKKLFLELGTLSYNESKNILAVYHLPFANEWMCVGYAGDNNFSDIMFSKREDILGYEVLNKSIKDFGLENVLGVIMWSISLFGFSQESVDNKIKEIEMALQEAEESESVPIESVFPSIDFEPYSRKDIKKDVNVQQEFLLECQKQFSASV